MGLASAQVKQGALFALAPAPLAIGQQAGRIANRILVEKVDPGAMAVANPEGLELHVNLTTARRLGAPETFAVTSKCQVVAKHSGILTAADADSLIRAATSGTR